MARPRSPSSSGIRPGEEVTLITLYLYEKENTNPKEENRKNLCQRDARPTQLYPRERRKQYHGSNKISAMILSDCNSTPPSVNEDAIMKSKTSLAIGMIAASVLFSLAFAAQTPTASPPAGKPANRPIPFHGMVSAIDQKSKTFTISGKEATRIFKVTEKTIITKGTGNAKFTDIVENQEVSGAYWRNPDGSLEAKMIRLGPTEKKTASPAPKSSTSPKS